MSLPLYPPVRSAGLIPAAPIASILDDYRRTAKPIARPFPTNVMAAGQVRALAFEAHGNAHAAADAQGRKSLLRVPLGHLVQQRQQHPRAQAPIGWPVATAPPFTFTFAGSQPRSLFTAQAWAAKASFAALVHE
jgi:hypothetical protein